MYISPINYQPKIAIYNLTEQKCNSSFKGNKTLKLGIAAATPILAAPLLSNCLTPVIGNTTYIGSTVSIGEDNKAELKKKKTARLIHHPDFYQIKNKGYAILASSYFRRGGSYGSPDERFVDVINALRVILKPGLISYFKDYKVKMLIGGIGKSQEPFSLLATAKSIMGKEKISDYLDTYIVDLQAQPDKDTVFKQSFYDSWGEPRFAQSSFVYDEAAKYGLQEYRTYRTSDEIFEYLSNTYSNPEKAKWKTRIQDALKEYPEREFDIVSINNTLIYLKNEEEIKEAVKNIYRTLRPGGIFISDDRLYAYSEIFTPENSVEIYPGIYQKR